jgi:phosphoglycerol transferase MdoB-like AlkP superfamily enzyme
MQTKIRGLFPLHLKALLQRLGIALLFLQLSRVVFLVFNWSSFAHVGFADFFTALLFDGMTIGLFFLPFIILSLFPSRFRSHKPYRIFLKVLFHLTNLFLLGLNLMDVVYFSYTSKRSTIDLLSILGAGNDFAQQIGSFFRDFWFLVLILLVFGFLANLLYKRTQFQEIFPRENNVRFWLRDSLLFIVCMVATIYLGRGGFMLKPLSPIDASQYTRVENTALVLNTPFTMLKSYGKSNLEEKAYYTAAEEAKLFNPVLTSKAQHLLPEKTNVVIILLESFGNEWVGASGAKESFTPFLDSLAQQSLFFEHGIANGKKSIEAVPAIIASIPSLLDNPYISSPYGNNKIESLPRILHEHGYTSGFFHGATNGSMKFDGFAAQAGFDHYFGRFEYNNDAHFDKTWGILDEYFNPWTARQLTTFKQPFFATLFTLSSHHPYFIPEHMRGKLRKGPEQICESINYGDYSLRKFFEEARKQPWYDNTLFVLCADHTSATTSPVYSQRAEMYKIPILFFHPKGLVKPKKDPRIFQQLDIMPTLLDLLNIETTFYSYGHSYYQNADPEAITYLEGTYHYFHNQYMLTFSNEKARNLYSAMIRIKDTPDSLAYRKTAGKAMEKRLKALIQRYNRDLILNQTTVNEKKDPLHH